MFFCFSNERFGFLCFFHPFSASERTPAIEITGRLKEMDEIWRRASHTFFAVREKPVLCGVTKASVSFIFRHEKMSYLCEYLAKQ
jgi:hypothetical protein